jgi:hypothetical protein
MCDSGVAGPKEQKNPLLRSPMFKDVLERDPPPTVLLPSLAAAQPLIDDCE